nr:MAG TPA: hypothetical protein [Caudoviricetes sp.]
MGDSMGEERRTHRLDMLLNKMLYLDRVDTIRNHDL